MDRFKVEITVVNEETAMVFEAYCPACEKHVYTCIGVDTFKAWTQEEKLNTEITVQELEQLYKLTGGLD
jgi:hypothetical protein